jgi:hypothetical protein
MIFSVQHFLEDYFAQRNCLDVDQYAVKLANLYARKRQSSKDEELLESMRRMQTVFYRNNLQIDRRSVERDILKRLDRKFKKKPWRRMTVSSPVGWARSVRDLRSFIAAPSAKFCKDLGTV